MFPPFHPFIHSILQYFIQHLFPATSIGTIPKYEPITLMRHLQHKVMFSAVLSPDKEFKGDPVPWFCSCPVERQRLIATAKLLCTVSLSTWCIWTDFTHFGLVPLFSFLKVLSSNAFVLLANVTQGSSKIRLGNIHINLDVLFLELGLEFSDFLREADTWCYYTTTYKTQTGGDSGPQPVKSLLSEQTVSI